MTRRNDYETAEKVSVALLTRAAFGTDSGERTAQRYGIVPLLISSVFARFPVDTRVDVGGLHGAIDRRRQRPNENVEPNK